MKRFLLLALCALFACNAGARTLYVDATRPNNNGNGLSVSTAKKTLQAAINVAQDGDTILVFPGTYAPITTNGRNLAIRRLSASNVTVREPLEIDLSSYQPQTLPFDVFQFLQETPWYFFDLIAQQKTFKEKTKAKKYVVTLKTSKNKAVKKAKVTLKVEGKTYKATTNSKGKATFKITKLTKKGKYTATVKYAGKKYDKAASKKVKITVK